MSLEPDFLSSGRIPASRRVRIRMARFAEPILSSLPVRYKTVRSARLHCRALSSRHGTRRHYKFSPRCRLDSRFSALFRAAVTWRVAPDSLPVGRRRDRITDLIQHDMEIDAWWDLAALNQSSGLEFPSRFLNRLRVFDASAGGDLSVTVLKLARGACVHFAAQKTIISVACGAKPFNSCIDRYLEILLPSPVDKARHSNVAALSVSPSSKSSSTGLCQETCNFAGMEEEPATDSHGSKPALANPGSDSMGTNAERLCDSE